MVTTTIRLSKRIIFYNDKAGFQADTCTVLAYAAINHLADLVLTSDTDLAALTGLDCVGLRKYRFIEKGIYSNVQNCEIFFAFECTMNKFIQYTNLPNDELGIYTPVRPIFNQVFDIKIRALYAVLLGCDVTLNSFLSGKQLDEIIKQNYNQHMPLEEYIDIIIQKAFDNRFKTKKTNLPFRATIDHESFSMMIKILIDGFSLEPANDNTNIEANKIYLSGKRPNEIHPYLNAFIQDIPEISDTQSITECAELLSCCGIGTISHTFLRMEGHEKCRTCEKIVCKTCSINKDDTYCVVCYGSEFTGVDETIIPITPVTEMISILHDMGHEINRSDDNEIIRDIYEYYNNNKENELFGENLFIDKVKYPIKSSNFLKSLTIKCEFNLTEGGSFICNNTLNKIDRIGIIELFAGLVNINHDKRTDNNQIEKLVTVLPETIVRFAENSRINHAYRLLRRSIRHANDPMFPAITNAVTKIFTHADCIGLYIQHQVKASMNPQVYNVEVAFTKDDLLSCQCNCRVGSCGSGRSVCVHILPVIYKITQILYQGLSEHLLVNFQNQIHFIQIDLLTEEIKDSLYDSLVLLINSTDNNSKIELNDKRNNNIQQILQKYSVGTELPEFATTETNPEKHGLFRNLNLESSVKAASHVVEHTAVLDESNTRLYDNDINNWDSTYMTPSTYQKIYETINIFNRLLHIRNRNSDISYLTNLMGYKLINMRRDTKSREYINENKMIQALSTASQIYRPPRIVYQPKQNLNLPIDSDVVPVLEEEYESEVQSILVCNQKVKKLKNRSCCAGGCNNTSFRNSKLSFTRVPVVSVAKVGKNSSDRHRKLSVKSKYKRHITLKRLDALDKRHKSYLEYCSNHRIVKQKFDLRYKDITNKVQSFKCELVVPLDAHGSQIVRRSNDIVEMDVVRKPRKKRKVINQSVGEKNIRKGMICDVYGCHNRKSDDNTYFKCVPARPKPLNTTRKNIRNYDRIRYYCRLDYRRRILINLGLHPNDARKEIRFCNKHKIITKKVKVSWYEKSKKQKQIICEMSLPEKITSSTNIVDDNRKKNKGTGIDRLLCRYISQAQRDRDNGDVEAATLLAVSQVLEQNELTINTVDKINQSVLDTIGLCLPCNNGVLKSDWKGKRKVNNAIFEKETKETKYKISNITDTDIKEFTGFPSLTAMIAFVVVACFGDVDLMTKTCSDITWFEEWLLYFDRLWGKACTRWVDCRRKYDMSSRCCRRVFDSKLLIISRARRIYPRYATLDEDKKLRKQKWSETYGVDRRLIMWDNSDVPMYEPTQAESQRLTFSQYYGNNVGKGSVFIQPCGWMGTGEIWTGGVSDTDYMVRSNILRFQKNYLPIFDSDTQDIKWSNITDKGYRITTAAWECGEQLVIQPAFAQSDKMFTSLQTLRSAAIAADRSGNERAVKYGKMCSYIGTGLKHNSSTRRMCDVWLCWSFQCNFMFRPVH